MGASRGIVVVFEAPGPVDVHVWSSRAVVWNPEIQKHLNIFFKNKHCAEIQKMKKKNKGKNHKTKKKRKNDENEKREKSKKLPKMENATIIFLNKNKKIEKKKQNTRKT